MPSNHPQPLRCWGEVDLAALQHNAEVVRKQVGDTAQIMAVVKANGYGHGAQQCVTALDAYVDAYGVANLSEAQRLNSTRPIYILSPPLPSERAAVIGDGFTPFVSSLAEVRSYAALRHPGGANLHLMIDTGMGRTGIDRGQAEATVRQIIALDGVNLTGVCTHLPCADEDKSFTRNQLDDYQQLVKGLRSFAPTLQISHVLNSAGIIDFSEYASDLVRPGLMLYGCSPIAMFQERLQPVLTLKSKVTLVRTIAAGSGVSYGRTFTAPQAMQVGTLSIGYADGLPRAISNQNAAVLIHGTRCALLGRVTMDQIVVDVSHLKEVTPGDEVVIIGCQGEACITVAEVAAQAGTISWEILTHFQRRVTLVYPETNP